MSNLASSGISRGDLIFYDWRNGGSTVDHVAIQVRNDSTDPDSGLHGALVDAHTSDRYHIIWTEKTHNTHAATTVVWSMQISTGN